MSDRARPHFLDSGSILDSGSFHNATPRLDFDILPGIIAPGAAVPIPMAEPLRPLRNGETTSLKTGFPLLSATKFPDGAWHPMLLAEVIVGEFGQTNWRDIVLEGAPKHDADIVAEIEYLVARSVERGFRMAEIMAQADDFTPYFANLMFATPTSHPATWLLISTALLVGRLVAMHFKRMFNRPRPVQIYPALMPPLLSPPHPSFPNAHALQANLMAECVALACPALGEPLRALAERIGENREVAGVHFRTDRIASMSLVPKVMERLAKGDEFNRALNQAKAEWSGLRTTEPADE